MLRPALALVLLAACSNGNGLKIPADRPILGWTGSTAADRNKAQLPAGFSAPDQHSCASDPTRVYIAELFTNGFLDVKVNWHWAPIVGGPRADKPTLDQPEMSLAGTVVSAGESGDDVLADHPFGYDYNVNIEPDPPYANLLYDGAGRTTSAIHTELETRLYPRAAFGFEPMKGDRALMRGAWILDCGHPPYDSEIHPPTFVHYARPSTATQTTAVAFVVPYRSSLLFSRDSSLAADFGNPRRFELSPLDFSRALVDAVLNAVATGEQYLTAHALMVANRFETLDWLVCAPLPRPAGAKLDASWRFATRTGVSLSAMPHEEGGCVRFVANMGADYLPMALPHVDLPWAWDALSASASSQLGRSIDVRLAIIDALKGRGIDGTKVPALQADHPPRVDTYPALVPRAGADADGPVAIERDDGQPYPFHGRVRVGWK